MLLADGERNVTNLCEALKLPQPTVSHHLGLLRMSNIIGNRRDGKQVFYSPQRPGRRGRHRRAGHRNTCVQRPHRRAEGRRRRDGVTA
jgi:DNA-binding transcriptional ArsR family regulator